MRSLGELVGVNINASMQGPLIESVAAGRRRWPPHHTVVNRPLTT